MDMRRTHGTARHSIAHMDDETRFTCREVGQKDSSWALWPRLEHGFHLARGAGAIVGAGPRLGKRLAGGDSAGLLERHQLGQRLERPAARSLCWLGARWGDEQARAREAAGAKDAASWRGAKGGAARAQGGRELRVRVHGCERAACLLEAVAANLVRADFVANLDESDDPISAYAWTSGAQRGVSVTRGVGALAKVAGRWRSDDSGVAYACTGHLSASSSRSLYRAKLVLPSCESVERASA